MAKAFGIKKKITSPTFILLQSYRIPPHPLLNKEGNRKDTGVSSDGRFPIRTLTHIDCYRLDDSQQLIDIGIRDHFADPHTLTIIEWADKVKSVLPSHAHWITLAHTRNSTAHTITLDKRLASAYAKVTTKVHPASHRKPRLLGGKLPEEIS